MLYRDFFSLNEVGTPTALCADDRGVFQHPVAAAQWKTSESGSAEAPIDVSAVAGREAVGLRHAS